MGTRASSSPWMTSIGVVMLLTWAAGECSS